MTGHTASIYSLSFNAESNMLVSGGADWTVRCWDVKAAGGLPSEKEKPKENGVGGGVNGMVNGVGGGGPGGHGTGAAGGAERHKDPNVMDSVET